MSLLDRWKRQYYYDTAKEAVEYHINNYEAFVTLPELTRLEVLSELIHHCISKWEGIVYLEDFNNTQGRNYSTKLVKRYGGIAEVSYSGVELDRFDFDGSSCALCRYMDLVAKFTNNYEECDSCPIYLTNKVPCSETSKISGRLVNPYNEFIKNDNPRPMLELLIKTYARIFDKIAKIKAKSIPVLNV